MKHKKNSLFILIETQYFGDSPSGKAADFDSAIRGFESLIPNHLNKQILIHQNSKNYFLLMDK